MNAGERVETGKAAQSSDTRAPMHVDLLEPRCIAEACADGVTVVRCHEALASHPPFLTDRLEFWAQATPDRVAFAQRADTMEWRCLTYRELLGAIQSVGEALLTRGLSADRPVAILSENDLDQAVLVLACQYVGIPVAPVSPAYSLISQDFDRLRHVIGVVRPGLVFVNDATRFKHGLAALQPCDAEIVTASRTDHAFTPFATLLANVPGPAVLAARDNRQPDDIAKILFTSGSTGVPKGVINTHRMIAANQQMLAQAFRFVQAEPPVMLDWLPWHHTFGGNHNFGLTVYNGGTFYIDDGRPTPGGMARTIRNLREISPTFYCNVPRGYADLIPTLASDAALAATFFRDLKVLFYSGASLDARLWQDMTAVGLGATGRPVRIVTSLGSTETAPAAIAATHLAQGPGEIGLPLPGVAAKLVPCGDKLELRLRGPNVMPGYFRQSGHAADCFDEDGFYKIGDAVRWVDPADPSRGFAFDGRIAEDFKLSSGTWVNVAAIKAKLLAAFAPFVRDVVVVGADREALAALLVADPAQIDSDAHFSARLATRFQTMLDAVPAKGSSERVTRIAVLTEGLSIDRGEVTDKGSINARNIIAHRADLVERLYQAPASHGVIIVRKGP
jgi:feruloyl-CoA synthase